jgi:NADP-dependent 3-hydroxy acid dehydrogenase YdfG
MGIHRVVAITGASAGIGRATALRLARDGASLVVCARRLDRLRHIAHDIEMAGGRALALAADVTQPAQMLDLVARGADHFGQLDAMVCNAGFGIYGAIDDIEPAQMQRLMDVNYMGTYHAIRAALPVFRRQARGHLFIISSIVGQRGIPFMSAYAATKFAQAGLAESLRAELRGTNIHVSTVFPISTETEFHGIMQRESGFATRASGPRQQPEDVANAIARALDRPVPALYPYRPAKVLAIANAIAPGLCDRLVRRWGRTPVAAT